MIKWKGWEYDEERRALILPEPEPLTPAEGAVLSLLLRANGMVVTMARLVEEVTKVSSANDPRGMVRMLIWKLKVRLGSERLISNVRGFGYRVMSAELRVAGHALEERLDHKQLRVINYLVDQFEATGPHARSVAKMIAEVYK